MLRTNLLYSTSEAMLNRYGFGSKIGTEILPNGNQE